MATISIIYVDNFDALIIIDRKITCNKLTRKPLKEFVIFSVLGKQVLHCGSVCAEHTVEDVSSESQEDGWKFFWEDQTFAELSWVVVSVKKTVKHADLSGNWGQGLKSWNFLALVHSFNHTLHWQDHV